MSKPPVFVLKTGGFYLSGETRLHLRRMAQIEDRLGQALAGGTHPRRILSFESRIQKIKAERANALSAFMVRVVLQDLSKK